MTWMLVMVTILADGMPGVLEYGEFDNQIDCWIAANEYNQIVGVDQMFGCVYNPYADGALPVPKLDGVY